MKVPATPNNPDRLAAETQAAILNAIPAQIALIDPEGKILAVNDSWRRFATANDLQAQDALVGSNYLQICDAAKGEGSAQGRQAAEGLRAVLNGKAPSFAMEYPCHAPTERRWFRLMATPVQADLRAGAVVMHINITERMQAEGKLARLNQLYQVLSSINETIIRVRSPQELFDEACRIAVARGSFRMAAILGWDDGTRDEEPLACAGTADGYFSEVSIRNRHGEVSRGMIGTTLRTGRHEVCNDIANDPRMGAWKAPALRRGYRSMASFPIKTGTLVVGAFALFSSEGDYFQEDEIELLVAVTKNVSFAIESLNKEQHRLRAEAALRASEANMAMAQRIAHFGSWELDLTEAEDINANPLRWSDEMYRIAGFAPGAVKVSNELFFQLVHPDDRESIGQAVAEAIRERRQYSFVHRLIRPDGEERIVHETAQIFFDEVSGQPTRMVGTAHDITEQRMARGKLARNESLLRMAGRTARLGGWSIELPDRKLTWSDEICAIHEVPPGATPTLEEAIHFFLPEYHAEVTRHMEACMRNGTPFDAEWQIETAKGRRVWVRSIGEAVRETGGGIIQVQGAFQDISESKRAEGKLREQATLLDKAQDAILVRDLEHQILFWNRSAERLYGWTAGEAVGRSIKDLLYSDPAGFLAGTEATLAKGEWIGELEQVTKGGKVLTVEVRWTLVRDDQGNPKSILAINTDITQRKKLEQQFLRSQRMESIGTLAGGIAHDLNNVLAPIMMSIDLLKLQERDPQRLNILAAIEGSAKRGADMVSQVLSFARGMEGQQVEVQIAHLLREVEKIAIETFLKNIRVHSRIPANLWIVQGDPTQLHQVLLNLCVNSRDAMPDGGTLTLSARNLLVDEHYAGLSVEASPGPHVVIQVEDTGTGMTPEVTERIFEPFFTTKELGKGTGLGLSTTLAIIKSHGGFVRVSSEVGVGTKFRVYLPAQTVPGVAPKAAPELALPRGNDELVLVVDDDAAVRQVTRQTLEAFGYRVLLASDGAEATAIYAVRKQDIAVVLTDMMMPVMDGPAAILALMRINPQVRIIAASGLNANGMMTPDAGAGVQQFIPKPYTAETLLLALQKVLR